MDWLLVAIAGAGLAALAAGCELKRYWLSAVGATVVLAATVAYLVLV